MGSTASAATAPHRTTKGLLILGFLTLTFVIARAYTAPPTGYEVSIYAGTPPSFWYGTVFVLSISLVLAFMAEADRYSYVALGLGTGAIMAILGLPLLRGYAFYGHGDPMTHLGWLRDLSGGQMHLEELFYPGLHSVAFFFHKVTGVTIEHALMLAVFAYSLPFLVFLPLIVRTAATERNAVPVALFSAFLFLPITNLNTYNRAHPYSQSILYSVIILYVAFKYIFTPRDDLLISYGLLFALFSITLVVSHPLQAGNIILLFVGITVIQHFFDGQRNVAGNNSLRIPTLFLGAAFALWTYGKDTFQSASRSYPRSVANYVQGSTDAGRAVASQSGSLADVGGSPEEMFVKIFSVSLLYIIAAGSLVLLNVHRRLEDRFSARQRQLNYAFLSMVALLPVVVVMYLTPVSRLVAGLTGMILVLSALVFGIALAMITALFILARSTAEPDRSHQDTTDALVTYAILGGALVVPLFMLFFVGNISGLYFRILGYLLMLATVIGAISVCRLQGVLEDWMTPRIASIKLVVLFAIILPVSVVSLYPSPYIYHANQQVTADNLQGYETAFRYHDNDAPLAGIRVGPSRYSDAIHGVTHSRTHPYFVTGANLTTLPATRPGPLYLAVTEYNRKRELISFRGLRYRRSEFSSLEHTPGVDKIQSTGGFVLYYAR